MGILGFVKEMAPRHLETRRAHVHPACEAHDTASPVACPNGKHVEVSWTCESTVYSVHVAANCSSKSVPSLECVILVQMPMLNIHIAWPHVFYYGSMLPQSALTRSHVSSEGGACRVHVIYCHRLSCEGGAWHVHVLYYGDTRPQSAR